MDGDVRTMRRLGPSCMVRAFGGPFEDFAFDDPRVGSHPACWIESLDEFSDRALPQSGNGVMVVRGKKSCATTIFE